MKNQLYDKNFSILDYVFWRGDLSFSQSPLNEIDGLIFSQLSYIKLDGLVPSEYSNKKVYFIDIYNHFKNNGTYDDFISQKNQSSLDFINDNPLASLQIAELLKRVAFSKRYENVSLYCHIDKLDIENEQQFSATTFFIDKKNAYIVYRGTDETLVGWKEDFNMSYLTPVPAQKDGVKYLNYCGKYFTGNLYVAGHSKGGNIAIYASAYCNEKIQKRIKFIENYDGPGFDSQILSKIELGNILNRTITYVPEHSIIGMLLGHEEDFLVVKSEKDGLHQHNPFYWCVCNDSFNFEEKISERSKKIDKSIKFWLDDIDRNDRKVFIDTLFDIMEKAGITTTMDFSENKAKLALSVLKSFSNLEKNQRSVIFDSIQFLFKTFIELYQNKEES